MRACSSGSARNPITASAFSGKTISSIGRTPRSNARLSEVVAMRRTYHADLRLGNDSGPAFSTSAHCLLLTAYCLLPTAFCFLSLALGSLPVNLKIHFLTSHAVLLL